MDKGKCSSKERPRYTGYAGMSGGDVCNRQSEVLEEIVKEGTLTEVDVDFILEGRRPSVPVKEGLRKAT